MKRSVIILVISVGIIFLLSFGVIVFQRTYFPFTGNILQQLGGGGKVVTTTETLPITVAQNSSSQTGSVITETFLVTVVSSVSSNSSVTTVITETNVVPVDQVFVAGEFPNGVVLALLASLFALIVFSLGFTSSRRKRGNV
jgi:hypothetical protein